MKRLTAIVILLALGGFMTQSESVLAQDPEMQAKMASAAYKKLLVELDKNHDGRISRTEHNAMYKDKDKAEANYKKLDLNQDGYLTEEEYVKAVTSFGRKRKP